MQNTNQDNNFMIPLAIIVAGILIGGAVIYSNGSIPRFGSEQARIGDANDNSQDLSDDAPSVLENIKPVTDRDHIRGDINASVKIIEFSDTECPFCKNFHETMKQVVNDYEGKVAWIYRHFPLDSRHPKARKEAEATECANELGGNDAFWAYIDRLFDVTPSNNGLGLDELPKIAEYVGLDMESFQECWDSGRYAEYIEENLMDAVASGGTGTPYSVFIAPDGNKFVISGAQPYPVVKQLIDSLLE